MDRDDLRAQSAQQRAAIREQHAEEIEACARLRDRAFELMSDAWEGRALKADAEGLIVALFCRSLDTYCASLRLAMDGYGAQAQMLNRSMFEDMVDAHWIATEPEAAIERYAQHAEHGSMLLAEVVRKYPEMWPEIELPEIDPKRRGELDDIYGEYGVRPWSTLNIHRRVEVIEHHWQNDEGKRALHMFRDLAQRENNETLHVSSASLRAVLGEPASDGQMAFHVGPRPERVDRALFGMFWTFAQTVGLMVDKFDFAMDEAERAQLFSMREFVTLTDEQRRDTGRNDPCPCGSGVKFKRCHGA